MAKSPPNVLLITCDQLRLDALGCYDNPVIRTPHIDALAARGVRFERTFTALPACAPNRASMATGRYPSVHGLRDNGMVLPESETTLMHTLRDAGYQTCGVGKMHFGPQWRYPKGGGPLVDPTPDMAINPQPNDDTLPWYGFDRVMLSEDNRVGPYEQYLNHHGYNIWDDPHSFSYPQHATVRSAWPEAHHQTTWVADRSIDMITDRDADRPMFMWTSFVHPHHPFNPPAPFDTLYDPADMPLPVFDPDEVARWPEAYRTKYFAEQGGHEAIGMHRLTDADWQRVRAYYYGMISLIDKQVGRLTETLKAQGILDNTLIVFTADHGEMLGDHHLLFKGTIFDEVSNVPLIIARPGDTGGSRCDELGCSTDLMPTILDLLGLGIPDTVQGASLMPCVTGEGTPPGRDAILIEHGDGLRVMRTGRDLLGWRGPGQRGEWYRLDDDPHCLHNRWDDSALAERRHELIEQLLGLVTNNLDPSRRRVGPC